MWDPYTVKWRVVATLSNENCDVFQYVVNDTPAHPTRDVLVVRYAYRSRFVCFEICTVFFAF